MASGVVAEDGTLALPGSGSALWDAADAPTPPTAAEGAAAAATGDAPAVAARSPPRPPMGKLAPDGSASEEELCRAVDAAEASERLGLEGRAARLAAGALWSSLLSAVPRLSPCHHDVRRGLSALARLRLAAGEDGEACGAALLAAVVADIQAAGTGGRRAVPVLGAALFAARLCWACGRPACAARVLQGSRRDLEGTFGTEHPAVREAMLTMAECAAEAKA